MFLTRVDRRPHHRAAASPADLLHLRRECAAAARGRDPCGARHRPDDALRRRLYVGCGNGRNYLPLPDARLRLYGLGPSLKEFRQLVARRRATSLPLIYGDFRGFRSRDRPQLRRGDPGAPARRRRRAAAAFRPTSGYDMGTIVLISAACDPARQGFSSTTCARAGESLGLQGGQFSAQLTITGPLSVDVVRRGPAGSSMSKQGNWWRILFPFPPRPLPEGLPPREESGFSKDQGRVLRRGSPVPRHRYGGREQDGH